IDWMHNSVDDSLRVLEFNPRPTPCYHLGRFAGVDFAKSIQGLLRGEKCLQRPCENGRKQSVYLFPQHPERCLEMREFGRLVHWLPGMAAHDVPWDEPRMLLR